MFGVHGTQDTSGYGKLQVHRLPPLVSEPPYGGYFDAVAESLGSALQADGSGFGDAVERVVVQHGELTFHVRREHLLAVADKMLHDPALRFEIFSGVSGVHYPKRPAGNCAPSTTCCRSRTTGGCGSRWPRLTRTGMSRR
jgi:NADH:ubiquinone oxidoreductase 27 kD subunit